jgi:hypothetical protein
LYQLESSVILKWSAKNWWIRPKSNSRETSGPANWTLKRYPRSRDQFPCLDCSEWPWTRLNSSLQCSTVKQLYSIFGLLLFLTSWNLDDHTHSNTI